MENDFSKEIVQVIKDLKESAEKAVNTFEKLSVPQNVKDEIATILYLDIGMAAGKVSKILQDYRNEVSPNE